MPTIAEIIAAKRAKAGNATEYAGSATEYKTVDGIDYARNAMNKEWVAQGPSANAELTEAINRIEPPSAGKCRAGLVLSAPAPIPPAAITEKLHHAEPRSLSHPQGEAVPMIPTNADKEVTTWHEAMNSFESSMCVMRDPKEPEVIWLAVRAERNGLPPILIHRLPWLLWPYPQQPTDNQPY